jgi:HemX protein
MDLGRLQLLLSTVCFIGGFVYVLLALRSGSEAKYRSRVTLVFMGVGFLLQTGFLYVRGQEVGRCPVTNRLELLAFLSWAIVLYYFVVGSAFRLSLLGFFSYPVVIVLQGIAVAFLPPAEAAGGSEYWKELHAGLALLSYGGFAMAGVAGVMFLVQEKHLKNQDLGGLFYSLPPIGYLSRAILKLMVCGFVLLTLSIAAAYMMPEAPSNTKLLVAYAVWALYALVLAVRWIRGLTARRFAGVAVGAFLLPLLTLWVVGNA